MCSCFWRDTAILGRGSGASLKDATNHDGTDLMWIELRVYLRVHRVGRTGLQPSAWETCTSTRKLGLCDVWTWLSRCRAMPAWGAAAYAPSAIAGLFREPVKNRGVRKGWNRYPMSKMVSMYWSA